MRWSVVPSPIGDLGVAVDDTGVCAVSFSGPPPDVRVTAGPAGVLADAVGQLRAYFSGELTDFDLPLSVRRGSTFERAVWRELGRIPYGQTRTYGEVAAAVGDGDHLAARAVGVACNRNPLPVVVPCHRVVGAGGKLVGFGGGLHRKRFLLELEARVGILRDFGG
ncbi:MAG: methylated-DNA--[protein]-cysteine S-methyltransferase [Micromonosporaceae bacterium]